MSGGGLVRVASPAKVNLYLEVLGRRADGFHELETALLAVGPLDVIEARPRARPGVELVLHGPAASADVPTGPANLAARAAELALAECPGAPPGIELRLEKQIPSRAGLGGGSSNAAAAFFAVEILSGAALPAARAETLLGSLGSDCVFFRNAASTGFAICKGRGEKVEPIPLVDREWSVALLVPELEIETALVYRSLAIPLSGRVPASSLPTSFLRGTSVRARQAHFNRLERAALDLFPALRTWRTILDSGSADHFRLSGSGSSFFGLYRDPGEAQAVLAELSAAARERGLGLRGTWVTRPFASGVRTLE